MQFRATSWVAVLPKHLLRAILCDLVRFIVQSRASKIDGFVRPHYKVVDMIPNHSKVEAPLMGLQFSDPYIPTIYLYVPFRVPRMPLNGLSAHTKCPYFQPSRL